MTSLMTALGLAATLAVSPAFAQQTCKVMDPTGTRLNVRAEPNGRVISTLPNGRLVKIVDLALDGKERPWALIVTLDGPRRQAGWVFREFIACLD